MHSEAELRGMFTRLVGELRERRICQQWTNPPEDFPHFMPAAPTDEDQRGFVILPRESDDVPGDAMTELLSLGHEGGHALSFLAGNWTDNLQDIYRRLVAKEPTSHAERRRVLEEERRAWRIARESLAGLGFTDWGMFDQRVQVAIKDYEDQCGSDARDE